jgi:RNase P subunit RPR2
MFVCTRCEKRQILFPDLSEGKSKLGATYSVVCSRCGHEDRYNTEAIERYQHPVDSLAAPGV